jgi:hypothetical protein
MGKMLPVDFTQPFNSTDIRCHLCNSAWGGLVYDPETDTFCHRDKRSCENPFGTRSLKSLLKSI